MLEQATRDYELVMILNPETTEEELASLVEGIDGMIEDNGGVIAEHDIWGLKRLAFPVKKFTEGNYVLTRFSMDPGAVSELNNNLNTSEEVLRFLVMKT